jgi:hypothetical protein
MSIASLPSGSTKSFRACTRCKLIKTFEQFSNEGCDNCKDSLPKDRDQVHEYTTAQFDGCADFFKSNNIFQYELSFANAHIQHDFDDATNRELGCQVAARRYESFFSFLFLYFRLHF